MPERRRTPRLRKRIPIVFDDGKQSRVGFSINFSIGGMSIGATHALPPGTPIRGKFTTREGHEVEFDARVQWSRQIQGMPGVPKQNTMGLAITKIAAEAYEGFLRELVRKQSPEETASTLPPAGAPAPAIPGLAAGLEGRITLFPSGDDLAAPPGRLASSISLGKSAAWIEEAAVRALGDRLPAECVTVGLSLNLQISHQTPVAVGSKLDVTAKLMQVGAEGYLTFAVAITEKDRAIAQGQHVRAVMTERKA